jgi:phosphatidylinositol glycan class Q protein
MYRIEIYGINSLCRIFFGKKNNVLRNRMESHTYINRQLFLATLLFSILLFVFPTVLVYYVVFAIVSVLSHFRFSIDQNIRAKKLETPHKINYLVRERLNYFNDI